MILKTSAQYDDLTFLILSMLKKVLQHIFEETLINSFRVNFFNKHKVKKNSIYLKYFVTL